MEQYNTDHWQPTVKSFIENASLIIFRPYSTPGVVWEFKQLAINGYLKKTVVVTMSSQKNAKDYYEKYDEFKNIIIEGLGINIGEPNPKARYAYCDNNNDVWETDDYFDIPIFRKVFSSMSSPNGVQEAESKQTSPLAVKLVSGRV
jgi:hypothetical protein